MVLILKMEVKRIKEICDKSVVKCKQKGIYNLRWIFVRYEVSAITNDTDADEIASSFFLAMTGLVRRASSQCHCCFVVIPRSDVW